MQDQQAESESEFRRALIRDLLEAKFELEKDYLTLKISRIRWALMAFSCGVFITSVVMGLISMLREGWGF